MTDDDPPPGLTPSNPAATIAEALEVADRTGAGVVYVQARPATSRDRDAAARGGNVAAGYGPPPPAPGERCNRCHKPAPRSDGIPCALCAPPPAALPDPDECPACVDPHTGGDCAACERSLPHTYRGRCVFRPAVDPETP